jgi:uncharacterized damage-inducible protein DinB
MDERALFTKFWTHESGTTAKVLKRIPEGSDYRPDPKSPDARWQGSLDFFGRPRPASPLAWSFLFDIVHHRGQITTYLRPMGSTVPQIYGPSGDEP